MDNIWFKIGWAVLLGAMILFLWPRARAAMANNPKAGAGDWKAVVIPLIGVVLFIALLIIGVRK